MFLISFDLPLSMTCFRTITKTGVICDAGSGYPSGVPKINPVFRGIRVAKALVSYVVFCILLCLFVFFLSETSSYWKTNISCYGEQ